MLTGHRMTGRIQWLVCLQTDEGNEGLILEFGNPQDRQKLLDFLDFEGLPYVISDRIVAANLPPTECIITRVMPPYKSSDAVDTRQRLRLQKQGLIPKKKKR